jgi:hypothetical protein
MDWNAWFLVGFDSGIRRWRNLLEKGIFKLTRSSDSIASKIQARHHISASRSSGAI